jgi:hypothetical protein
VGAALLVATTTVLATQAGALASAHCADVSGPFSSHTYFPPPCLSPIGFCLHSTLSGGLSGGEDLTFQTLVSAGDPTDPSKFLYTGDDLIALDSGPSLSGEATGVMHITSGELAPFVTTVNIQDGTRQYNRATGQIVESGSLDLVIGLAAGTYTGTVCRH